ncbi:MAG: M48 family metalloprotease, partial [Verrucomicrobiota bacterium]
MLNFLLRLLFGGVRRGSGSRAGRPGRYGITARLAFAALILGISYLQFRASTHQEVNPFTGETQTILRSMNTEQEIAMGLAAVPEMKKLHGGDHPDPRLQVEIDTIGMRLLRNGVGESPYDFEFHLLQDPITVNAFALPGGQVFMTYGLWKLLPSENERAGVLGHEIAHVLARHSAQQMAVAMRNQGIAGAAGVLVADSGSSPQMAGLVNQMLTTRYGREDEYESDDLGVAIMMKAGYDPEGLIGVMEVLNRSA